MSIFGAFDAFGGQGRQLTQGEIDLNNSRARSPVQDDISDIHNQYAARIRNLEIALAIKTARAEAVTKQGIALKKALQEVAPSHYLFQKTGRKCKDGTDETNLQAIFIKASDDSLRGKVPGNPRDYRTA
jgi:dihydroxyacid dehydratase/phosphogluconate dehydratase